MSMFGDYKAYKKFEPAYPAWKYQRDLADAKRLEYLKQNPSEINKEDIQRGRALLRAVDIMDEYSQVRAENMEVATETVVGTGQEIAMFAGMALGLGLSTLQPVKNLMGKILKKKNSKLLSMAIPTAVAGLVATIGTFPLNAWAAKAEVSASRRGRFESMRKELANPKVFAVLTPEQEAEARKRAQLIPIKDDNLAVKIGRNIAGLKEMALDSAEYKKQRKEFLLGLNEDERHINDEMTPEEIEKAKRDQQLLTKLVEKVDIASQDYAENAELAGGTLFALLIGGGVLTDWVAQKILNACNVKSKNKIGFAIRAFSVTATILASIAMANISKQASRVGRFVVKRDLMKHPEQLVYVEDAKTGEIKDVKITPHKKQGVFEFLKDIHKNNKDYNNYKKTTAKEEKKFFKAMETLDLTPEQMKDAKRLQKNTFKTFNKIDENSQKYSENIEALGQSVLYPISLISTGIGLAVGLPYILKRTKSTFQQTDNFIKYMGTIMLSSIPAVLFNAYITKEQKKASRIADMLAINEMQDYRQFRARETE